MREVNRWAFANPTAWSVLAGVAFGIAWFAGSIAYDTRYFTTAIAATLGGIVFGLLTFLTLRSRSRRLGQTARMGTGSPG